MAIIIAKFCHFVKKYASSLQLFVRFSLCITAENITINYFLPYLIMGLNNLQVTVSHTKIRNYKL